MIQRYSLSVTTQPTEEPVGIVEAREFLRIDATDEDALLGQLITAARTHCETVTNRSLVNTTWRLDLDAFQSIIRPPRSPLSSVSSIKYYDSAGTLQTVASTVYTVDTADEPGRIFEAADQTWPTPRGESNDVQVSFVAGYGSTGSAVPSGLRMAILQLVAHWYANREPVVTGTIATEIPWMVERLLAQYTVPEVG